MTRNGSPHFYNLLQRMAILHDKKSHDYASNTNPMGNYHFAGQLCLLFSASPKDAGFVGRLGEKLYRLANLESNGKIPLNESIEDTEIDICVITLLWMADRIGRRKDDPEWNANQKSIHTRPDEFSDLVVRMCDSQLDELIDFARQVRLTRQMQKETPAKSV